MKKTVPCWKCSRPLTGPDGKMVRCPSCRCFVVIDTAVYKAVKKAPEGPWLAPGSSKTR